MILGQFRKFPIPQILQTPQITNPRGGPNSIQLDQLDLDLAFFLDNRENRVQSSSIELNRENRENRENRVKIELKSSFEIKDQENI